VPASSHLESDTRSAASEKLGVTVNVVSLGPNLVLSGEFEANGAKVSFKQMFSDISTTMTLRQYNSIDRTQAQLFGTTEFTRK
jgi:hypothetical protein